MCTIDLVIASASALTNVCVYAPPEITALDAADTKIWFVVFVEGICLTTLRSIVVAVVSTTSTGES